MKPHACMLSHFSHFQFCVTLWTTAHQAPLSQGFPRQEYWSVLPFPFPGDLPDPGIKPGSHASPLLAGGFFIISTTWEAQVFSYLPPNKEKQRQADVLSMPLRGKVGISRYLSSLATLAKSVSPNKICSLIYSLWFCPDQLHRIWQNSRILAIKIWNKKAKTCSF